MESSQKLRQSSISASAILLLDLGRRACITLVTSKMTRCSNPLFKSYSRSTCYFALFRNRHFHILFARSCRDGSIFLETRLGSVILCCAPVFGNALKVSLFPRQCIGCPERADGKSNNALNINRPFLFLLTKFYSNFYIVGLLISKSIACEGIRLALLLPDYTNTFIDSFFFLL